MCPERRTASPAEVPIHSDPWESASRDATSSEGSPSPCLKICQRPSALYRASPWGVANHVAFAVSSIATAELDGRLLDSLKVVMCPPRSRLTPLFMVAAHTDPSGL